jgi:anti-sigma B factor antagonist
MYSCGSPDHSSRGLLFQFDFGQEIAMPIKISPSKIGSVTLVNLKGTIVAGNDQGILHDKMQELLEAGGTNFILDLGQVTYLNHAGIRALIEALNLATDKGGSVKLLHLTKQIHDVLQIAELSAVFGIYDDLQKALESFEA